MKSIRFPACFALAAMLLVGCSPASEPEQTAAALETVDIVLQTVTAPTDSATAARVRETLRAEGGIPITVDAAVTVPAADAWYTQVIRPTRFPEELLLRIIEHFFPHQIFFTEQSPKTKSELEAERDALAAELPTVLQEGSDDAVTGALETQAWIEEQLETAPEVDLSAVLSLQDVIDQSGSDGVTVYAETGGAEPAMLTVINTEDYSLLDISMDREELFLSSDANELFSAEAARDTADALLTSFGTDGFLPTEIRPVVSEESGAFFYAIRYRRGVGGLPVSDSTLFPRPNERVNRIARYPADTIEVRVSPAGIAAFSWIDHGTVENASAVSAALLTLDAVLPSARMLLPSRFSELSTAPRNFDAEVIVQDIALEYRTAPCPENPAAFRLEPAWAFYGNIRMTMQDGTKTWMYELPQCFLALSATDGRDLLPEGAPRATK